MRGNDMYCIQCGVKLADTEQKCPLCATPVCCPPPSAETVRPLYPKDRMPSHRGNSKVLSIAVLVLFLLPLAMCFSADITSDGALGWFWYVAGGLAAAYVSFALPLWFRRPNPVIFVPCAFAAVGLYLLYIALATGGSWFLPFALPVTGGLCLIVSAVVTLLRYLRRGRLYILGGAAIALGGYAMLVEFLLGVAFGLRWVGWSVYPMNVLILCGGFCIYLAINPSARETMERKLFF